jgi:heme-degrading monooxygenase HmoA
VSLFDQLSEEVGPVVLVNTFKVAPEDAKAILEGVGRRRGLPQEQAWLISTQLHRGIAGISTFLNYAVWESLEVFRDAFSDPQFQATFANYQDSTVASPQLVQKVAVRGTCVDR